MELSIHITELLPHDNGRGYGRSAIDAATHGSRADLSNNRSMESVTAESVGGEYASVAGCSANNGVAGRSLNANNHASNGNDNYAGAFAGINEKERKVPTTRPTRSNTDIENRTATGGYGWREYGSHPYMGEDKAESDTGKATSPQTDVWLELKKANSKRNLKGLSKFYGSKEIAAYAVRRTCRDRDTAKKREYYDRAEVVAWLMIREIVGGTYYVRGYDDVDIPPRFKSGKHRLAKVFTLYDRCVQMFVLTIIEVKLRNKVLRNNYSNIAGRGIYCNDRRYCMADAIRTAIWKHPDDMVLLTDIRKFYDNVSWKVMCGVLFETIKDRTTRWLILTTLRKAGTLPIGSCLSPLFADLLMNDYDDTILRTFKPHFFAAFGDNRCFLCDKEKAIRIQQFTKSYYEGRYGVELKGDYQIKPASAGFSFCRKQFCKGFVRERAEIRRRAVRSAHNTKSFAGYNGMLAKTDSRHLLYLIAKDIRRLRKMRNSRGMEIPPFAGEKEDFGEFADKRVCITNYRRVENNKDSGYYYLFQIVEKDASGGMRLCRSQNGSFEIKQAGDKWLREHTEPPIYVTVRKDGRRYYFEEYHTDLKEACETIASEMNITL